MAATTGRTCGRRALRGAAAVAKVGSAIVAIVQPIAAMHRQVIFLHGMSPCFDPSIMSAQLSMARIVAIEACVTGTIAIAVDWPNKPVIALNSRAR